MKCPGYQCPWSGSSSYQQISIRRLSQKESEEMLYKMLGVQEVAAEVRDLVQRKAEGNPFFMEELILELLESSLVCKEDKVCHLLDQAVNPRRLKLHPLFQSPTPSENVRKS